MDFYYDLKYVIFSCFFVFVDFEFCICVVGENGVGKFIMLKLFLGDLVFVWGIRYVYRNLKIGYFS